jgi:DNA-binding transcriptional ArsR family regulator
MSRRNRNAWALAWQAQAPVFAALGDNVRLRIVTRLCDGGPMSITSLTAGSRVTRQAVSKHLLVLQQAGLVRSARRGRERIWRLEQRRLKEARHYLETISEQWDEPLGRLRALAQVRKPQSPEGTKRHSRPLKRWATVFLPLRDRFFYQGTFFILFPLRGSRTCFHQQLPPSDSKFY